ncbi:MAG: DUF362 domain-containing protein [Phycisphaerae bacterium]|nr:DUF362 domain-containing protein [Phycisphaerae bacterium]
MEHRLSRRSVIWSAAAAAASGKFLLAQETPVAPPLPAPAGATERRPVVSIVKGDRRRQNVCDALVAIEDQILPVLKTKKYVVIKPNIVNTRNQLASTHVDSLHGILDFLAPRFKGPAVIAESAAAHTPEGYEHFHYPEALSEHKPLQVSLVDLNEEAKFQTCTILDGNLHAVPVRLAARLLDPEAYIICSAILKTHNTVIATLSIKNMALGAPLHSTRGQGKWWNDKRLYHGGVRQTHFGILMTAQRLQPCWGATVIDGYEGMEGNGPNDGTPVPSRVAIASTDYVAADRVGVEAMGIDPSWIGYLQFCGQAGLGHVDLAKIDIRGAKPADVARKYKMHADIERELRWMGEMKDVPEKLG